MVGGEYPELLEGLDAAQRAAVTSDAAPLAIQAGPGSGKTRVLTRRIAWRIATERDEAKKVLAVTFTRRAAQELTTRLGRLGINTHAAGVTAGTLHAIALGQLRRRAETNRRAFPQILERKTRILFPLINEVVPGGTAALGHSEALVMASGVASDIEWAKARLIAPTDFATSAVRLNRDTQLAPDQTEKIYAHYENAKRTKKLVDFEDLLWWLGDALETDAEFAGEQRWRFRHLFVDEFQDVSAAQLRVIKGWLGDRTSLTVVGDPDQAIFSFAGADPTGLTEFEQKFPGAETLSLNHNYRSTPQIVAAAEALLSDGLAQVVAGISPRAPRETSRPPGPWPTITQYEDDITEAAEIAKKIRAALTPTNGWSSFAVLYRINAQSAGFEAALAAAGIPMRLRGDARFMQRPEVRAVLTRLEKAAARAPGLDFASLLSDLGDQTEVRPDDDRDDDLGGDRDDDLGGDRDDDLGGKAGINEHAAAIVRLGQEYLAVSDPNRRNASVTGFLLWLETTLQNEAPEVGGDAVELITFHRAKGLEFTTVFITGLEQGLVPLSHAKSADEQAEERRLLYVAITRAEENLHLSWAARRSRGNHTSNRAPSPWLVPIGTAEPVRRADQTHPKKSTDRSSKKSPKKSPKKSTGAEKSRAHLKSSTNPRNAALAEAISEWRRNRARAAAIPAYIIFPDTTLNALVAYKPQSNDELLEISGIGPARVERYGEELLEIISQH